MNSFKKTKKHSKIKKKGLLMLLVSLLILSTLLASCQETATDPLSYQQYPITARGDLQANGTEYEFTARVTGAEGGEITFQKPDTLRDYIFKVTPEGATLSYGDMTIDFSKGGEKTNIVLLVPSLFSLDPEKLVSSEETVINSVNILKCTYKTEQGDVTVYINKDKKVPMRFELEGITVNIIYFTCGDAAPVTPAPSAAPEVPKATPTPSTTPTPSSSIN